MFLSLPMDMSPASKVSILAFIIAAFLAALIYDNQPSFGDATTKYQTPKEIQTALEQHYRSHGEYIQVLPDSKLPLDEQGTVAQKLGKDLPPEITVHVYEHSQGDGYQIMWETPTEIHSISVGPESKDRTWVREKEPWIASTTPL